MSEITGGVKNAMERREPIEKIRQSFINAGYSTQEVQEAINEATSEIYSNNPAQTQSPVSQINQPIQMPSEKSSGFQQLPSIPAVETKKSYTFSIIIIIMSILILVGAGLAGLYWDKLTAIFK